MRRIPEPELMDDRDQARAYAGADFSEPHERFIELCRERLGNDLNGTVLDLGCGPGDITCRFAEAYPRCRVHGVDGSAAMLELARADRRLPALQGRIEYFLARLPGITPPRERYDILISNSLLHHLHQSAVLWQSIRNFGRPAAAVFVMDLLRPESRTDAQRLVSEYAANESEILRKDFFNSLLAAYRPREIREQLRDNGLEQLQLEVVSDRHYIVFGQLD